MGVACLTLKSTMLFMPRRTGQRAGRWRDMAVALDTIDLTPRIGTGIKADATTLASGRHDGERKAG
jgi:hypothetical protein